MSLGTGLGSFMSGLAGGYKFGTGVRDDWDARQNKQAIQGITTQGNKDFETAKQADPSLDFSKFYADKIVPMKIDAYRQQGDDATADKLQAWSDGQGVKEGTKLFGSAMIKGQDGDMEGALNDFIGAGKAKGYLSHNFTLKNTTPIKDYDGNVTGYKVTIDDGSGKPLTKEFHSADEIMKYGATFMNPDSAFQSWQAGQASKADDAHDLAKESAKLGLKRQDDLERRKLGLDKTEDPGKTYDDAYKAVSGADISWNTKTPDEQNAAVADYIAKRKSFAGGITGASGGDSEPAAGGAAGGVGDSSSGQPSGGPKKRVLIDTVTGQPVAQGGGQPAAAPAQAAPTPAPAPQAPVAPPQPVQGNGWDTVPGAEYQAQRPAEPTPAPRPAPAPRANTAWDNPLGAGAPVGAVVPQGNTAMGITAAAPQAQQPQGQQMPVPRAKPAITPPKSTPADDRAAMSKGLSDRQEQVVKYVVQGIQAGADQEKLKESLISEGVPPVFWPTILKQ